MLTNTLKLNKKTSGQEPRVKVLDTGSLDYLLFVKNQFDRYKPPKKVETFL